MTAQLYFDIAVRHSEGSRNTTIPWPGILNLADPRVADSAKRNEAVTKLKKLASATTFIPGGGEDVFAVYTPGYPSLLYGRWLREYEGAEPAVWRKCFRARILEQINGLSDDDPTNDTTACRKLAMSLFQAGDEKRAGAIVAVLYKTLEEYVAEKKRQRGAREEGKEDKDARFNTSESDLNKDANPPGVVGASQTLIGPHEACGKIVTAEAKTQQPQLGLHLAKDAWGYRCFGCERDAEDTGDM